ASGLLAVLFLYLAGRGGWSRWFLVTTGLLPPLLLLIYSLGSDRSIFHTRYLCFAQLAWLAGVAAATADMADRPIRRLLTIYLVSAAVVACYDNRDLMGVGAQPGMREAVRRILNDRTA